jgi:glycosyltransferase involved in cell wall biosynthesis
MMEALNLVCVSHNAPPMNDAEALCTIRLLSALAQLGANVHLVAAEVPPTLDESISRELFDSRIKVTYVPADAGTVGKLTNMARAQFHGNRIEWLRPAVAATNAVLRQYRQPILMTRAFPMVSNLVGYYCRKNAHAWVAHFSDPYPPYEWQNHWYSKFLRPINRRWAQRMLTAADRVTVTCPNVIRYMEEKTGVAFREKTDVVTHLALPKLKPGGFKLDRKPGEFVVAYIGALMTRRRPDLLLKGALLAMERHPQIRFLQYGYVDAEILELCRSSPAFGRLDMRHIGNLNPRDAADLQEQVDVNVIVDTDLRLPYSPFILSKFPHSVCAGRPMLTLSTEDSDMARFTAKHGGGEFVPFSTPEAVAEAICRLYARREEKPDPTTWAEYQAEFSPERIARPFYNQLCALLPGRERKRQVAEMRG